MNFENDSTDGILSYVPICLQDIVEQLGAKVRRKWRICWPRARVRFHAPFTNHPPPSQHPKEFQYGNTFRANFVLSIHDISGFSSLCNRWKDTPDLVADKVNSVFDKLIEIIASEGGDIISFAGDALIVGWSPVTETTQSDKNNISQTVRKALNAVEMVSAVENNLSCPKGDSWHGRTMSRRVARPEANLTPPPHPTTTTPNLHHKRWKNGLMGSSNCFSTFTALSP
jgi:hypothetical protein